MAICKDNSRKLFYIQYKEKDENTGLWKSYNIKSPNWSLSLGKRYMLSIEDQMIQEDKKKRHLRLTKGNKFSLEDLINGYTKYIESSLKESTSYGKALVIKKYIDNSFDITKEVNEALTIRNITSFRDEIGTLDVTSYQKNRIIRTLRELIEYSIDRDLLTVEYGGKLTRLLKPFGSKNNAKEKIVFWTNEEWERFYNSFDDDDKFKMLFRVDYECALRIGELLALKWEDIDFKNKIVTITKSFNEFGKLTSTKNSASTSEVSISDKLANDLMQYKIDTAGSDDDWVFFADGHTSRTTIRRVMDKHIDISGVTNIKFHGLRHSCASRMINAGCDVLLVSKHLRHSNTSMTLDTYSHLFPNRTKGLVDKIF